MTNSAFETFNAYLPYDNEFDILTTDSLRRGGETSLRYFPESADSNLRGGTKSGSASEEIATSGDSLNSEAREKCRTSII